MTLRINIELSEYPGCSASVRNGFRVKIFGLPSQPKTVTPRDFAAATTHQSAPRSHRPDEVDPLRRVCRSKLRHPEITSAIGWQRTQFPRPNKSSDLCGRVASPHRFESA